MIALTNTMLLWACLLTIPIGLLMSILYMTALNVYLIVKNEILSIRYVFLKTVKKRKAEIKKIFESSCSELGKKETDVLSLLVIPVLAICVIVINYVVLDGALRLAFPLLILLISFVCISIFKKGFGVIFNLAATVPRFILFAFNLWLYLVLMLSIKILGVLKLRINKILPRLNKKSVVKYGIYDKQTP